MHSRADRENSWTSSVILFPYLLGFLGTHSATELLLNPFKIAFLKSMWFTFWQGQICLESHWKKVLRQTAVPPKDHCKLFPVTACAL